MKQYKIISKPGKRPIVVYVKSPKKPVKKPTKKAPKKPSTDESSSVILAGLIVFCTLVLGFVLSVISLWQRDVPTLLAGLAFFGTGTFGAWILFPITKFHHDNKT